MAFTAMWPDSDFVAGIGRYKRLLYDFRSDVLMQHRPDGSVTEGSLETWTDLVPDSACVQHSF